MKFIIRFVVFLAAMPVFIMFVGMGAAGSFASAPSVIVSFVLGAAALAVGYLAIRALDEHGEAARDEAPQTVQASTALDAPGMEGAPGHASPAVMSAGVDSRHVEDAKRRQTPALLDQPFDAERGRERLEPATSES